MLCDGLLFGMCAILWVDQLIEAFVIVHFLRNYTKALYIGAD